MAHRRWHGHWISSMIVNITAYMYVINNLTNSLLRFVHPISQRHQSKMHSYEMRHVRTSLESKIAMVKIKPIKIAKDSLTQKCLKWQHHCRSWSCELEKDIWIGENIRTCRNTLTIYKCKSPLAGDITDDLRWDYEYSAAFKAENEDATVFKPLK